MCILSAPNICIGKDLDHFQNGCRQARIGLKLVFQSRQKQDIQTNSEARF